MKEDNNILKDNSSGKIELLEERAIVSKDQHPTSRVIVSKQLRTKTVNVPVELTEEVLIIDAKYQDQDVRNYLEKSGDNNDIITYLEPMLSVKPQLTINGSTVSFDNGPIEIVLSRETATVQKQTYAVEDVAISKSVHTHKETISIDLKYEELDVTENSALKDDDVKR